MFFSTFNGTVTTKGIRFYVHIKKVKQFTARIDVKNNIEFFCLTAYYYSYLQYVWNDI